MKSLQIAATGMAAQQTRVDVVLTPGTITSQTGTLVPAGIQIGTGVRPSTVSMQITQGAMRPTGAELDLAIDGTGFLEVNLPSGEVAYTRDGKLNRSPEGELVTMDGFPLSDGIVIPDDALRVCQAQRAWEYCARAFSKNPVWMS